MFKRLPFSFEANLCTTNPITKLRKEKMQDLKFEIYKPKKFALLSKISREITLKLKQKLSSKT